MAGVFLGGLINIFLFLSLIYKLFYAIWYFNNHYDYYSKTSDVLVTYRSYVSQVKMKILRPEIEEINKKFSKDAVKRQQETMSLYSRAGANPMSGCLPALVQLPVFYALFSFSRLHSL